MEFTERKPIGEKVSIESLCEVPFGVINWKLVELIGIARYSNRASLCLKE
jgi:hypothetical protein